MPGLLVMLGTLALSLPRVWLQQQQGSLNSTELQHVADRDSVEGDSVDENTTDIAAIEDSSVTPWWPLRRQRTPNSQIPANSSSRVTITTSIPALSLINQVFHPDSPDGEAAESNESGSTDDNEESLSVDIDNAVTTISDGDPDPDVVNPDEGDAVYDEKVMQSPFLITNHGNKLEYVPTSPFLVSSDYNNDRGHSEHQVTVHDVDDQESLESRLSPPPLHNVATDSDQRRIVLATALQQLLSSHGDLLSTSDSPANLLSRLKTSTGNDAVDAGKILFLSRLLLAFMVHN